MCSSLARASPPHPETPFPVQRQTWREPIGQWLPLFHGRYVGLGYSTSDALGCADPATFYNNYVTMVKAILRSGKIPLIQTIVWAPNANIQRCAPPLNAKIHQLYPDYPQIISGPDAWTYFKNHPNLIGSDGVHPDDQGPEHSDSYGQTPIQVARPCQW
jgi:hypothetical protein